MRHTEMVHLNDLCCDIHLTDSFDLIPCPPDPNQVAPGLVFIRVRSRQWGTVGVQLGYSQGYS